jgi:hypothetical protein
MGEKSFEQVQTRRKTHVAGGGVGMMIVLELREENCAIYGPGSLPSMDGNDGGYDCVISASKYLLFLI